MQNLRRNERAFWYAVYQGREIVADADGNPGGVKVLHGNPVKAMGNISPANGQITQYQFGENADYDRTIVLTGTDWPIDTPCCGSKLRPTSRTAAARIPRTITAWHVWPSP